MYCVFELHTAGTVYLSYILQVLCIWVTYCRYWMYLSYILHVLCIWVYILQVLCIWVTYCRYCVFELHTAGSVYIRNLEPNCQYSCSSSESVGLLRFYSCKDFICAKILFARRFFHIRSSTQHMASQNICLCFSKVQKTSWGGGWQ